MQTVRRPGRRPEKPHQARRTAFRVYCARRPRDGFQETRRELCRRNPARFCLRCRRKGYGVPRPVLNDFERRFECRKIAFCPTARSGLTRNGRFGGRGSQYTAPSYSHAPSRSRSRVTLYPRTIFPILQAEPSLGVDIKIAEGRSRDVSAGQPRNRPSLAPPHCEAAGFSHGSLPFVDHHLNH
jgi:hypothetical protein